MIRVLLADDHALMREGLKQLFEYAEDIEVSGEACNGEEVLSLLQKGKYDLLLLDVTMPGLHGAELIAHIRQLPDSPPILMLSMHCETQIAKRKLKAGAAGYITKDSAPSDLMDAMRRVAAGGRYLSPNLAERMAFETGDAIANLPHALLTDRELHILRLLVSGRKAGKVAEELGISIKTVSAHKAHIKNKMNIDNDAMLMRYAVENGLIR
ncbi:MAG TPA: response regulator transcription factor [Methylophilaceae bacterium]|jgi:DNA-binding NarL/FixJ family response regulator|nr:response regulator transcription factor [Methylophilaceae bacterium]